MSAPLSVPPSFPRFRARETLPVFLAGWLLGALLVFGGRALVGGWLGPCAGRTLLALLFPLLLGPGGLMFTAFNGGSARRAALGLGLVVSSLLPALYVGALDISRLRAQGCAGGYIVLSSGEGRSVSRLELRGGEGQALNGRIGGFSAQEFPGPFKLEAQSSVRGVTVRLPQTQVRVGESFAIEVAARPGTPINVYTVTVAASQPQGDRVAGTSASIDVDVRP